MRKLNEEYFILEHFKNSNKDITLRELQDKFEEFNKSVRSSCWPDFGTYGKVYYTVLRFDKWLKIDDYTVSFIGDRASCVECCDFYFKFNKPYYDYN